MEGESLRTTGTDAPDLSRRAVSVAVRFRVTTRITSDREYVPTPFVCCCWKLKAGKMSAGRLCPDQAKQITTGSRFAGQRATNGAHRRPSYKNKAFACSAVDPSCQTNAELIADSGDQASKMQRRGSATGGEPDGWRWRAPAPEGVVEEAALLEGWRSQAPTYVRWATPGTRRCPATR